MPRYARWMWVVGLWVVLIGGFVQVGCTPRCIPSASERCACPGGTDGAQVCQSDGTYAACQCGEGRDTEVSTEKNPIETTTPEESTVIDTKEPVADGAAEPTVGPEKTQGEQTLDGALEATPDATGSVEGIALFQRLAGLWTGMASRTPLGTFAMATMDFRDASPHVMFGRSDLDAENNLRFAFSIETHGGKDVLIYRNGGYFVGLLRDSRTELVSYDAAKSSWRFCAIGVGCSYIDATFTFPAADQMVLDVKVRGKDHMYWQAERKEQRTLPQPYPTDLTSQGTGDAPFPPMPSVKMRLTWSPPLAQDAFVWFVLSTTACGITLQCNPSRSIRVPAKAGATSAEIDLDQVHVGKYYMNAILDRNNNAATTFFPDSGDGIGQLDVVVDIKANQNNSASSTVFYNFP
ncbi:MAG: hypothetical protein H6727_03630 [Myxococcales bacterium]|nr:hypothetical protein [Myxococcales bacterium]